MPKKYAPFSKGDSRAIETAFQKLCDAEDDTKRGRLERPDGDESRSDQKPEQKEDEARQSKQGSKTKVPVNEDYLFDVDVEERELAPAYWLGPVYNVRRGTWFYHGSYLSGSAAKAVTYNNQRAPICVLVTRILLCNLRKGI